MTIFDNRKALWMWEFSQQAEHTLPDACDTAKNLAGADILLVKAMDGTDWMSLYDPAGFGSVAQFRAASAAAWDAAGVTVIPWVVPHGQNPSAEAAAHAQLGPVVMVDLEPYASFWTGPLANLMTYFGGLRSGGVQEIHVSLDPRSSALAALGAPASLGGLVDAFHPQCYWTDFQQPAPDVLPMIQDLQGSVPVYPVLPGDGAAGDLFTVWTGAQGLGCTGVSVWRLGSMTAAQLQAFGGLLMVAPAPPPAVPSLDDRVTALEGDLARLNDVLAKRFELVRTALDPANPPA